MPSPVYPLLSDEFLGVVADHGNERTILILDARRRERPAALNLIRAGRFGQNLRIARNIGVLRLHQHVRHAQLTEVAHAIHIAVAHKFLFRQLSSFQLPFREIGYKAARTLDQLLHNKNPPHRTIRIAGLHLFERGSTAHVPPATMLVEKARAYIARHACEGIHVDDVVSHLGVSRSLLDLRFRQMCSKSVLEDILDVRLAEVRRQLVKTDHTILQIGRNCGFNDPDNLKRLFKSRYGLSMRTWRKANTLGP